MFLNVLFVIGILAALCGLGHLILRLILPHVSPLESLSIAYPLGSGLFTFLLFLLSWIGVPLNTTSIILTAACFIFFVGVMQLSRRRNFLREHDTNLTLQTPRVVPWGDRLSVVILLCLAAAAGYLAVMRGYSTWDAIGIWAVKGMGIAQEGTVFAGSHWGSHGLSYPLNLPLQIATFRLLGKNLLVYSKLIFPMFYFSFLVGAYAFLSQRSGWKLGFLGVVLLGTTPILFEHGTIGYANLPFTTYLVLGLMNVMRGIEKSSRPLQVLGGILLGLASWTRPEGVFVIVPMLIVLYLAIRLMDLQGGSRLRAWLLPPMLIIAVWQAFMVLNGAQGLLGEVLRSAWTSMTAGDLNLIAIYWTARYAARQVIDPGVWGLIVPVGLLFVIFRWREVLSRQNDSLVFLVVPAVTVGLSIFAYYYLASFQQDIQYLLGTSVNRLFMPVWAVGFLGVLSAQGRDVDVYQDHSARHPTVE